MKDLGKTIQQWLWKTPKIAPREGHLKQSVDVSVQRELTNRSIKNETLSISLLQEQVVDAVNYVKFQNIMQNIPELPILEPDARIVLSVSEPVHPSSPSLLLSLLLLSQEHSSNNNNNNNQNIVKIENIDNNNNNSSNTNNSSNKKGEKIEKREKSVSVDTEMIGNLSIGRKTGKRRGKLCAFEFGCVRRRITSCCFSCCC